MGLRKNEKKKCINHLKEDVIVAYGARLFHQCSIQSPNNALMIPILQIHRQTRQHQYIISSLFGKNSFNLMCSKLIICTYIINFELIYIVQIISLLS